MVFVTKVKIKLDTFMPPWILSFTVKCSCTSEFTKVERGNSSTISSEIVKINDTWKLYFVWNASFNGMVFDGTTIVTIFEDELNGYYFTNSNIDNKNCTSGSFVAQRIIT